MTDASDLQAGLLSRLRVARRIRLGHAGALAVLGFAAVATLGVGHVRQGGVISRMA